MAGPPDLVKTMAEALGMPAATLTMCDRCLSEAGLRSKHGRGRGVSTVNARDAAHLLTAVLASPLVKDSARSVERYAATCTRRSEAGGGFANLCIAELTALTERSSFVDALEALFAAVASGSLRATIGLSRQDADRSLIAVAPLITVMATTPATIGEIRLGGVRRKTAAVLYALPEPKGCQIALKRSPFSRATTTPSMACGVGQGSARRSRLGSAAAPIPGRREADRRRVRRGS